MTAEARLFISHSRSAWFVVAAAVTIVTLVSVFATPRAIALGALAAWLFCLSVTVGAAVWLLIGALTGGRWLVVSGPHLVALARLIWVVALPGVLFAIAGPVLYPWWTQANGTGQTLWLNPTFFMVRTGMVLILWSILGLKASNRLSPLAASLALVGHGVAVSVAGVDWMLSLEPSFLSTAFGAHFAILQLALALAVVTVMQPAEQVGDIGALLLACMLGVFYLAAMEFVVSWSGNLPEKAMWYLARQEGGGGALLWVSLGLGVLVPFCALLTTAGRCNAVTLRWIGAAILTGGLSHLVWLTAPGAFATAGLIALAVVSGAMAAFTLIKGGLQWQMR